MTSSVSAEADTAVAIPPSRLFAAFLAWADEHPEHPTFSLTFDRRWPSVDFINIAVEEARRLLTAIPWEPRHPREQTPPELRLNQGEQTLHCADGSAFGLRILIIAQVPDGEQ